MAHRNGNTMTNFTYVARDRSGIESVGSLTAVSIDDVVANLHGRGLSVLHIQEDRSGGLRRTLWEKLNSDIGGANTRALALFSRQLSTVLQSGIPLVRGLTGLAADGSNRTVARAVRDVCMRLEQGQSLSEAMAARPGVFNRMYLSMIRAGERAGTLDVVVDQLAIYLEKIDAIKTKLRSAMSYPTFVLVFAVAASLFLLLKIVPTFADIYAQMQVDLPSYTLLVMRVSSLILGNLLATAAVLAAVVALFVAWARTKSGRYIMHRALLATPVFGPIVRKAVMSRFTRTLGILIRSGLPIMESLDLVKGTTGNAVVERAIGEARVEIERGAGITDSFRRTGRMPEMVLQMMATGEESGALDELLMKTSDFYDREVDASVEGLSSLLEPLLMVIVGALIGAIVIAMFLPIFSLGDAIMRGGANL